jgi:ABC-type multidrug transport system fused ATPase/permease subunit
LTRDSELILMAENGETVEKGSHRELLALNRHYAAMYRTQTGEAVERMNSVERR